MSFLLGFGTGLPLSERAAGFAFMTSGVSWPALPTDYVILLHKAASIMGAPDFVLTGSGARIGVQRNQLGPGGEPAGDWDPGLNLTSL